MGTHEVISQHIFLFPFTIEKDLDLKSKTQNSERWQYTSPAITEDVQYNERVYFYEYVHEALYNHPGKDKNETSWHYDYKNACCGKYIINIGGEEFFLCIENISLHIFDTGIAILEFNLANRQHPQFSDILKINDFGRRIYPQFLPLEKAKKAFLPCSVTIQFSDQKSFCKTWDKFDKSKYHENLVPDYITELLDIKSSDIKPVLDDRMFTVCWYGNNEMAERIHNKNRLSGSTDTLNDWYRFVFVDGGLKTCQCNKMTKDLIRETTNTRWVGYDTLYGISRYSFVCLTSDLKTLRDNNVDYIPIHIKTMYKQMAILALAQRASVMRFSRGVTDLSNDFDPANISKLYKNYIGFINKIYFREVTAQEQGIDLYDLLLKNMRTHEQVRGLDEEIEELNTYATIESQKHQSNKIDKLTIANWYFLPLMFIASILGMNLFVINFEEKNGQTTINSFWNWIPYLLNHFEITIVSFLIIWLIYFNFEKIKNFWRK